MLIEVDGSLQDWYAKTPPGPEASGIVACLVRESQKQTGVKYPQFSLVGASNMLVKGRKKSRSGLEYPHAGHPSRTPQTPLLQGW